MTDLLTRLESGSGSDRELDLAIATTLFPEAGECAPLCEGDEPIFWNAPLYKQTCPAYTTSVDAGLAAAEMKLPGWQFTIYHDGAYVSRSDPPSIEWGRAKTPARSLVAALLRALDQEPQT